MMSKFGPGCMMPAIFFFDVHANDIDCAKGYCSNLFRWSFEQVQGGDYWEINHNEAITMAMTIPT
jgi:predicted enzyme related to lactoylglutathione lyase